MSISNTEAIKQGKIIGEIAEAKATLHLRLTYEDWKEIFKQLTRAEIGVFYAIRTLDPFGDRPLDLDCKSLGEELDLHRTTVSDALKSLSEKNFIDLEITKARVKPKISNLRPTLLKTQGNGSIREKNGEKTMRVSTLTSECGDSQVSVETHSRVWGLTSGGETRSGQGFQNPHTLTHSSNFFNTTDSAAADENLNFERKEKKYQEPTEEELIKAKQEILRLTPDIKFNSQVRNYLSRYWANFPAALANCKKRLATEKVNNPTGLLMHELRSPSATDDIAIDQGFGEWFNEAKRQKLASHSMGEEQDIRVFFRSGESGLFSQLKDMPWEEIIKRYSLSSATPSIPNP